MRCFLHCTARATTLRRFIPCCWRRAQWLLKQPLVGKVSAAGRARLRVAWLKPLIIVLLLAAGVHLAPIVVPVFSPDKFIAYTKTLPFKLPVMEHSHARAVLPQWYADQFGWQEIVD